VVPVPGRAPDRAGGFVTTQFVLAVALSLVLFVMLCNVIVYQYARGVVRAALDEGVRTASRAGGDDEEERGAHGCSGDSPSVAAPVLRPHLGRFSASLVIVRCPVRK